MTRTYARIGLLLMILATLAGPSLAQTLPARADMQTGSTASPTPSGACRYDLQPDGVIDITDIMQDVAHWGSKVGDDSYDPTYDFDLNGAIDVVDVMTVAAHWGESCVITATPTTTPTPTATPSGSGRSWPDTTAGVHVFNDQLTEGMSNAQVQFAATHYAGTQKMVRSEADRLRAYNPNFLILHYRLGLGLGYRAIQNGCQPTGSELRIVEGNQWVVEWPGDNVVQSNWFFPWNEQPRVLNCDWGWYVMELNDPGWRSYWIGEVLRQLAANDDDGLFADSFSVPNYFGAYSFDPALPPIDSEFENAWGRRIEDFTAFVVGQFGDRYAFIPNVGTWVTTRNPTDYSGTDGVMIEGFGYDAWAAFSADDWRLQLNRVLSLVRQNKIILAQSYRTDNSTTRMFTLGSYLLIKGSRTFVNLDTGLDPEWWPEYEIPIGSYSGAIPASLDDLYNAGWGVYARSYSNGMVLVNPGPGSKTVNLGGTFYQAEPSGGGDIPGDGQEPPGWTVTYTPVTQVSLPAGSAAVLLSSPPG